MTKNSILNTNEIDHKIKRIAYQIFETYIGESKIILAGISSNGFILAQKIAEVLKNISNIEVVLCEVKIDKQNPLMPVSTSIEAQVYMNQGIVLVDDVLNSGSTLIYAVKHFLDVPLGKFKTAVLVDRNHKKFPVKVDFKGISLSTSLQEHVQVVFNPNGESEAYLC
jgi:pyrimidine operon attenuation protein / uracil phosphoribosyltransferase